MRAERILLAAATIVALTMPAAACNIDQEEEYVETPEAGEERRPSAEVDERRRRQTP